LFLNLQKHLLAQVKVFLRLLYLSLFELYLSPFSDLFGLCVNIVIIKKLNALSEGLVSMKVVFLLKVYLCVF